MVLARDFDKEKQPSRTVRINQQTNKGLRIRSFFRGDKVDLTGGKNDRVGSSSTGAARTVLRSWAGDQHLTTLKSGHICTICKLERCGSGSMLSPSASISQQKRAYWGPARAPVEVASSASNESSVPQERHLARKTRRDPPEATKTATSSWCVVRECWSPPCWTARHSRLSK